MKRKNRLIFLMLPIIATLLFSLSLLSSARFDEEKPTRKPPNPIEIETSLAMSRGEAHLLQPGYIPSAGEYYTWTSSNTSVATVTSYGLVNGISSGTATVTVVLHTNDWGNYTKTCSVTVGLSGIISNGTYVIKNVAADKYVDVEGPSTSNGAYLQLWGLTAESRTKWTFTLSTDGYYRIRSLYSNKFMRTLDNSGDPGLAVIQYSTSSVIGAKWALMATSTGNYAFVPASSTSSLVVMNAPGTASGTDLYTAVYSANSNYSDEWMLAYSDAWEGYQVPSTSFSIQVDSTVSASEWYSLATIAVAYWNNAVSGINISLTTSYSPYKLTISNDTSLSFGTTSIYASGIQITSATITIFSQSFSDSANPKISTLVHEIGHLLGLNDNPPGTTSNESIMNHGRNREMIYVPQSYDIHNIKVRYNL